MEINRDSRMNKSGKIARAAASITLGVAATMFPDGSRSNIDQASAQNTPKQEMSRFSPVPEEQQFTSEDKFLPFTLNYPSNWKAEGGHYGATFENPEKPQFPNLLTIAAVMKLETKKDQTIDQYVENDSILQQMRNPDMKFTVTPGQKVDGHNAWKLDKEYTVLDKSTGKIIENKYTGYYFYHSGDMYVINFSSNPADFDHDLPKFEKMLQSFKMLSPDTAPTPYPGLNTPKQA